MVDKMAGIVVTEDGEIPIEELDDVSKEYFEKLKHLSLLEKEKKNLLAIFTKARNAYIEELKSDVLRSKSGIEI